MMSTIHLQRARPRSGWLALVAAVAAVALIVSACGSSGGADAEGSAQPGDTTASEKPVDGGSLVVAVGAETSGWNPGNDQWADAGNFVGSSVLEPLAEIGPDKGAKPWLAESWIANDAFDSWLIKLRPGVTFQNGEAFDAAAVKKNFDFLVASPLAGIAIAPMVKNIEVVDPLSVQINLTQPWGAFPSSIMAGATYMMAPAMIDSSDQGSSHPIGTGPFTFDSWQPGGSFKAKKNPTYWQEGLPHLDSIEFKVIPDDTSRAAALATGDVNMILTTSAALATDLAGTNTVVKDWSTENAIILANTAPERDGKPNPLGNIHARRALAYATDRQAVAAVVGEGVDTPTSPWAPTNPWGLPDDQNGYVDHDVEKAKAELAEYTTDTGEATLSFTVLGTPGEDDIKVLQLLQSQYEDVGIDMKIETLEQTAYISRAIVSDFQALFSRNYGYADPDTNYIFWAASSAKGVGNLSINFAQFTSPELEAALNTGRESGYIDVRKEAYHEVARQLNAGLPDIWLYRTPYSLIADPQVKGMEKASEVGFGNYQPKTWFADLWRSES
jgi:peptide/nickel transport system substrate-binding protein